MEVRGKEDGDMVISLGGEEEVMVAWKDDRGMEGAIELSNFGGGNLFV